MTSYANSPLQSSCLLWLHNISFYFQFPADLLIFFILCHFHFLVKFINCVAACCIGTWDWYGPKTFYKFLAKGQKLRQNLILTFWTKNFSQNCCSMPVPKPRSVVFHASIFKLFQPNHLLWCCRVVFELVEQHRSANTLPVFKCNECFCIYFYHILHNFFPRVLKKAKKSVCASWFSNIKIAFWDFHNIHVKLLDKFSTELVNLTGEMRFNWIFS